MEPTSFNGAGHPVYASRETSVKLPQQSPGGDEQDWSGDSSAEEERGSKRKRPLSVSCEICKQRKVRRQMRMKDSFAC
jgi:hypothetical protein